MYTFRYKAFCHMIKIQVALLLALCYYIKSNNIAKNIAKYTFRI